MSKEGAHDPSTVVKVVGYLSYASIVSFYSMAEFRSVWAGATDTPDNSRSREDPVIIKLDFGTHIVVVGCTGADAIDRAPPDDNTTVAIIVAKVGTFIAVAHDELGKDPEVETWVAICHTFIPVGPDAVDPVRKTLVSASHRQETIRAKDDNLRRTRAPLGKTWSRQRKTLAKNLKIIRRFRRMRRPFRMLKSGRLIFALMIRVLTVIRRVRKLVVLRLRVRGMRLR